MSENAMPRKCFELRTKLRCVSFCQRILFEIYINELYSKQVEK